MATFHPTAYYIVQISGGQYVVNSAFAASSAIINTDQPSDPFAVGDSVNFRDVHGNNVSVQISAFTSDGIIVSNPSNSTNFLLYSTNDQYQPGDALVVNVDNPPVCFVQGTLIDTVRGSVPIESLVAGDQLVGSRGTRTVKWIGWRKYHAVSLGTVEQRVMATPIRILAGALGEQLPTHDLRVSPWHHLFIDGVLIRAKDLVNGVSVIQELDCVAFDYYHIELDHFDVIRAHGVYSESWADGGNRDFFQNVSVTQLRPEDQRRRRADRPGFAVLRTKSEIAALHARIAMRAQHVAPARQERMG